MPKKKPPPDARSMINQPLFDALNKEGDRAAVLIGASVLDSQLEDLFRASLVGFTPKDSYEGMYGSNGPLATFSARINLAYCLGWISDEVRRDLHAIRGIRNRFAHGFEHDLSLRDPEFSAALKGFRTTQSLEAYMQQLPTQAQTIEAANKYKALLNDPRRPFIFLVSSIAFLLGEARERAKPPTAKLFEFEPPETRTLTLGPNETVDFT
jgi:DNA-binding MltR family transcriptional regulator